MFSRLLHWLWLAWLCAGLTSGQAALVGVGEVWRYSFGGERVGDVARDWRTLDYDDHDWRVGRSGFSYGYGAVDATVVTPPTFVADAHRFRARFFVDRVEDVGWLTLRVDYDDGFVAYLNGVEVARRNVPGGSGEPVPLTAVTPSFHARGVPEEINLGAAVGLLRSGTNILAIQLHRYPFSSAFALMPELLGNLTRGPVLQSTSSNATAVVWRTAEPTSGVLVLGSGGGAGPRRFESRGPALEHVVWVDGLLPGQEYAYEIESVGGGGRKGKSGPWQMRTLPVDRALEFVILGDSGAGTLEQMRLADQIELLRPDLVMHLGDIVYGSFTPEWADLRCFSVYRESMARAPFYFTMGNHDLVLGDTPYLDAFYLPTNSVTGTEHYYSYDAGPAHFSVLYESWFLQTQLTTNAVQLEWLRRDLAATRQPWKFIVLHHPVRSSGAHRFDDYGGDPDGTNNGLPDQVDLERILWPIAMEFGVQFILSGHDHHYERFAPVGGVTQIVSGGGGVNLYYLAELDPLSSQFWLRHHVVHFRVDREELTLKAVGPTGDVFDTMTYRLRNAPVQAPYAAAWASPRVETMTGGPGLPNLFNQTYDLVGPGAPAVLGRSSNLGELSVNLDADFLYVGLRGLALAPSLAAVVFLEVPGQAGVTRMRGVGDGAGEPGQWHAEALDLLEPISFEQFRPSVGLVLGDERADRSDPAFARATVALANPLPVGQGAFRLTPGLEVLPGVRLQQFNRSPEPLPVEGDADADFVEVAIPRSGLGDRLVEGSIVRLAAITVRFSAGASGRVELSGMDDGFIGGSLRQPSPGEWILTPVEFVMPHDPDPDRDGLVTEREVELGLNPMARDTDGDGLPDGWEVEHQLDPLQAGGEQGGEGDPDRDGFVNRAEELAGTDPREGSSLVRLAPTRAAAGGVSLSWQGVAGRRYVVELAARVEGPYVALREIQAGDAAGLVSTLVGGEQLGVGPVFLRLRVER